MGNFTYPQGTILRDTGFGNWRGLFTARIIRVNVGCIIVAHMNTRSPSDLYFLN
jgi:hypothetical protein